MPDDQEDVAETLLRINNWVEENEHIVLNFEPLFFPVLHKYKKVQALDIICLVFNLVQF